MKKITFIKFIFAVFLFGGCKSRVDYGLLNYEPEILIDYGAKAKEGKISVGAEAFAKVDNYLFFENEGIINEQIVKVEKATAGLKTISTLHTLIQTQADRLSAFIGRIENFNEQKIKNVAKQLNDNSIYLIALRKNIATMLKADDEHMLDVAWLNANMPSAAKKLFVEHIESYNQALSELYKVCTAYSLALELKANKEIAFNLKRKLSELNALNENTQLFAADEDMNEAKAALTQTKNRLDGVDTLLDKLPEQAKVKQGLVEAVDGLKNSLSQGLSLKSRMLDKVAAEFKGSVEKIYNDMVEQFRLLESNVNRLDESVKDVEHPSLAELKKEAFLGKYGVNLSSELKVVPTDLARLTKIITKNKVVQAKGDESSEKNIEALAYSIVSGRADKNGLFVDNIYVLNDEKINSNKFKFSMDDLAFKEYTKAMAQKAYQQSSDGDKYANLYVIFSDNLATGADIEDLIIIFSQGKSRVLVVSNAFANFAGARFMPQGLDLLSAHMVAKAWQQKLRPSFTELSLADSLARLAVAFSRLPEKVNLFSMESLVRDSLLRLPENSPSKAKVTVAVEHSLMAYFPNIKLEAAENSGIFVSDLKTVSDNLGKDPNFYKKASKGVDGLNQREVEAKRLAEMKRNQQIVEEGMLAEKNRQELAIHLGNVNDTRRKLTKISNALPAGAERAPRVALLEQLSGLYKIYGRILEKLYELPPKEREKLENGSQNDFKAFFAKLKTIVKDRSFFDDLKNLTTVQLTLRNNVARVLPNEILTMQDRYSVWHPYAYFSAATRTHTAASLTLGEISAAYAALSLAKFSAYPAPDGPTRPMFLAEQASLLALIGPPADGVAFRAALQPLGFANLPPPIDLAPVRFEKGTSANTYLAGQIDEIKVLAPIWSDLVDLMEDVQDASGRIYRKLRKARKS